MPARELLGWLYPPHCCHCGAVLCAPRDRLLCPSCYRELEESRARGAICSTCGLMLQTDSESKATCTNCQTRKPHFDVARAALRYSGPASSVILSFKYRGDYFLGPRLLTKALEAGWVPSGLDDADAVIPVPLHPRRERERGYNQAALLARTLARHFGLPLWRKALRRTRYTSQQTSLVARRRWDNVRGAFEVTSHVRAKCLLLVDDVMTTGATASECARALKKSGAGRVNVLTLARTQP